jgi:hypothetical protein
MEINLKGPIVISGGELIEKRKQRKLVKPLVEGTRSGFKLIYPAPVLSSAPFTSTSCYILLDLLQEMFLRPRINFKTDLQSALFCREICSRS